VGLPRHAEHHAAIRDYPHIQRRLAPIASRQTPGTALCCLEERSARDWPTSHIREAPGPPSLPLNAGTRGHVRRPPLFDVRGVGRRNDVVQLPPLRRAATLDRDGQPTAGLCGREVGRADLYSRPGSLVVTSWTSHVLPSGSLKEQKDP
jgi:hypothetical protein